MTNEEHKLVVDHELRLFGRFLRFFPRTKLQWIGPLAAAAMGALAIVALVLISGIFNFSATQADPPGLGTIVHSAFLRSTERNSGGVPKTPEFGTFADVAKGAGYFGTACAHCHGAPGLGQNPIALSMRPRPQYLPSVLNQFDDQELFRIVKHGVKMSGMPAYPVQNRDDEVWSIVSFLRVLPKLSVAQYRTLAYGDQADPRRELNVVPPLADKFTSRPYPTQGRDELAPQYYRRTSPSLGFDDLAMSGDPAGYCARCHVAGGRGRNGGTIPDLTLLDPRYLRNALNQFATGRRHSGFMMPVATQLSPEQMGALAAYYAKQQTQPKPLTASPAVLALGQRLANQGLDAGRTAACSNCHAIDRAAKAAYPTLDAQHPGYLASRMRAYRVQPLSRSNPMPEIARRLNDRQIDALAAWYGSRPPRN